MRRVTVFMALLCLAAVWAAAAPAPGGRGGEAEAPQFSISMEPGVTIPLGNSAAYYTLGGGAAMRGELSFPSLPFLFFSAGVSYGYSPLQYLRSISTVTGTLGAGLKLDLTSWLAVRAFIDGGAYNGFMNDPVELEAGIYPFLSTGAGLSINLGPSFSLELTARYENCFSLYQGIRGGLAAAIHLGARRPPSVHIKDIRFDDVFSVFYKYYDDHTLGDAILENRESAPLTNVKARFLIKEYMDSPKECEVASTLKPGESQRIALYGLFKDKVLDITEATKVPAEITVEYVLKDEKHSLTTIQTLRMLDRNAMSWDDDRRAAAFVTAKDPTVLGFAKNVLATAGSRSPAGMDRNLLLGMAIHDALALQGMSYSPDPARPYSEMSKNKQAVDFLQFPRQTLDYRAGDCDDLSILNCALLESLNVATAFITVPGHIFMAFALDMEPEEARKTLLNPEDLIYKAGKAWVPVEITLTKADFLDAWVLGTKEWREESEKGQAAFYPLSEAWAAYEPVGLPGSAAPAKLPTDAALLDRFQKDIGRFVDREIAGRVTELQNEIKSAKGGSKSLNKLGVLYARYGQAGKAEQQFGAILQKEEYLPALVNLGNLALLQGDQAKAIGYFGRGYRKDAANPSILLGLAIAYYQKGDSVQAVSYYNKLQGLAPDLAERHAYLNGEGGSASRAAQAGAPTGRVEWAED